MLKALFLALNVRPDEEKPVLLLLGKGFFMGIFLATYQVSAETLFLNRLEMYLKEAIMVSGFLGIVTTALFATLQNRLSFSKLALGNLISIFLFTALIYSTFIEADRQWQDYIIFVMFAMIGPILAVSLLGFWGVFGRLFDLRQSKRIIGGIDIGQLSAAILTSFAIPFLEPFIPNTSNYLIISGISILISFGFLILITVRFDLKKAEISTSKSENTGTGIKHLVRNNYVRLLSVFLIFSMVAFTFVQYSFQGVVAQQYPEERELRNFLAIFNGAILVLGLILQTFVNDRIIGEYGLKTSLIILPVILAIFTIGAIVAGTVFGYTLEAGAAFIWFFLFIALSRLFNFSLRDSLENPTFKLYFMPLDNRIRFDIQAKVEGVVNEASRFIAGLLIIGLSFLTFFELIHYSYTLIFILMGYFVMVGKLYNEYRNRVKIKLQDQQRSLEELPLTAAEKLLGRLERSMAEGNPNKVIFAFKLLEKVEPQLLPQYINSLMDHQADEIREFAQVKMNEIKGLSVSERYVISIDKGSHTTGKQVVSGSDILDLFKSGDVSKARLSKLCKSENSEDRQYAAELLSNKSDEESTSFLIELLHDLDPKVRNAAIKTAQKKYNQEVLNALIDNLNRPSFSVQAANALTIIGGKALSALDSSFYKSGQPTPTMIKIVRIIGRIGGKKATEQLWNKIDYPDKLIVSQVLLALGNSGFKANITQIPRIKYAIESDIEDIAWNIGAINEVSSDYFGNEIKQALQEEIDYDVEHIYMLLSMLYDSKSIQLVKENIESRTNEGVTYAIELLDVFLSEDLKQRIIPVLDDLPYTEKAKKLEIFYPRERIDPTLVLKFLLNRDFSQTNRWTKACILYQMGLMKLSDFAFDLIAHLFNPDKMIREMAAWALHEISQDLYGQHVSRLNENTRRQLDAIILDRDADSGKSLVFEKVLFLKGIPVFDHVYGLVVASIADIIQEVVLPEGTSLSVDEHYNDNFFIIYKGSINLYENGEVKGMTKEGEFIGELINSAKYMRSNLIVAITETTLFKINKDDFYELLSDNINLAEKMVSYV
ncbi:hypothetical protein C900_05108 [Fulvivirga imtechensis AK7]|uniref:Cyclic nucleotide-binding domain-containing protein n=1 Tax=Fulvivirga imtechensis AK7 TaxID=1237149 RepID=L8JM91_9BACT|nr:HEAT repeat domain-containing protein [Fulvivirga imtechensis]ELR69328.1 hypothetical protein C900_05108 [Fulvivirga imtechensis AK7]